MSRNYGLHIVTGSAPVGGNQTPSPHYAHDTQRDLPPLPRGSLAGCDFLERGEISEPSLDERELGARVFSAVVILAPVVIVGGLVLSYLALVPQSIQN